MKRGDKHNLVRTIVISLLIATFFLILNILYLKYYSLLPFGIIRFLAYDITVFAPLTFTLLLSLIFKLELGNFIISLISFLIYFIIAFLIGFFYRKQKIKNKRRYVKIVIIIFAIYLFLCLAFNYITLYM